MQRKANEIDGNDWRPLCVATNRFWFSTVTYGLLVTPQHLDGMRRVFCEEVLAVCNLQLPREFILLHGGLGASTTQKS